MNLGSFFLLSMPITMIIIKSRMLVQFTIKIDKVHTISAQINRDIKLNNTNYQLNNTNYQRLKRCSFAQLSAAKHALYPLPNTLSILTSRLLLHSPITTSPSSEKKRPLPSTTSPLNIPSNLSPLLSCSTPLPLLSSFTNPPS